MVLALVAAVVAAAIQSAVGFGFALVLSPIVFAVVDPGAAVLTMNVLALFLNTVVLFEGGWPRRVEWRRLAPLLAAALPGLVAGAAVLAVLSKAALQVVVGVAVIAAAAWQLHRRRVRAPRRALPSGAGVGVGFVSGALTTSIGASGPPVVLWLESHGVGPGEFRQTLAATFLALAIGGGAVVTATQGIESIEADVVFPLMGCLAVGYALGLLVYRRLDTERFYMIALLVVLATGVASVVAGLR